jgi:hypothetical protein
MNDILNGKTITIHYFYVFTRDNADLAAVRIVPNLFNSLSIISVNQGNLLELDRVYLRRETK